MRKLTQDEVFRFYCEARKVDAGVSLGIVAPETIKYWIVTRGLKPAEAARTLLARPVEQTA